VYRPNWASEINISSSRVLSSSNCLVEGVRNPFTAHFSLHSTSPTIRNLYPFIISSLRSEFWRPNFVSKFIQFRPWEFPKLFVTIRPIQICAILWPPHRIDQRGEVASNKMYSVEISDSTRSLRWVRLNIDFRSSDPDWVFFPPRASRSSLSTTENEKRKKKDRESQSDFNSVIIFRVCIEKEERNWGKLVTMPPKQVKETLAPKEQALFRQILVISTFPLKSS